jgi:hypothetical protein
MVALHIDRWADVMILPHSEVPHNYYLVQVAVQDLQLEVLHSLQTVQGDAPQILRLMAGHMNYSELEVLQSLVAHRSCLGHHKRC